MKGIFVFFVFIFLSCSNATFGGPIWVDLQSLNVQNQSSSGRTGQWWCDNNFGKNLGGSWECVNEAGSFCATQAPNYSTVKCGRISSVGTTEYLAENRLVTGFGYGRVEQVLVKDSSGGRTGKWWCDNHFGKNLGGWWRCRGVSGQSGSCSATVPNDEVVSCSQYETASDINIKNMNATGRTGQWWCSNHFGGNLAGSWDCLSATGNSCATTVPANGTVTCGRYTGVDESKFAPVQCTSSTLDDAEKEFCANTNYMTERNKDNLYIYNNYVRVGLNKSYGGAIFELYGSDKENRIQEHGGAAMQLSLWAYEASASGAGYFLTKVCDATSIFTRLDTCTSLNGDQKCALAPTNGNQISDCITEKSCVGWSAASPWNPLQAQAKDCGWNGPSNDVTNVFDDSGYITATKVNPYNFTKSTSFNGLTWSTSVKTPHNKPYAHIKYSLSYTGPYSLSLHNQEVPAIFATNEIGYWYYFYSGSVPYSMINSAVTRLRSDFGTMLKLPGRSSALLPLPTQARYYDGNENWLSVCNKAETQCITIASFSPEVATFSLDAHYLTAVSRSVMSDLHGKTWSVYIFPYRFDDVVEGKSVRQHIFDIHYGN